MKTNNINITILEASEGMLLRKNENHKIITKKAILGQNDKIENWEEVDEELAINEKEEIEKKEEELNENDRVD